MRFDLRWVLPSLSYVAFYAIYWLLGGNFERGLNLGLTTLLATVFAIPLAALGADMETARIKILLDKYRKP